MTYVKIILNIIKKNVNEFLFVLVAVTGVYSYQVYRKLIRLQNEKTTFAYIYNINNSAKGQVHLEYYFLTEKGDTVKSTYNLRPDYSKSYYLKGKFLVKYDERDLQNNEIILDKSY